MTVDTTTGEVLDLGIERLVHIDQRIDSAEGDGIRARWEFGQAMLSARDGKGRLPNGYLSSLVDRTGKSRSELNDRQVFAAKCPTEDELLDAIQQFGSWYGISRRLVRSRTVDLVDVNAEPEPAPEGTFSTIVADPPWRYGNTSTRGAAEDHYPTMSIEELCELGDLVQERTAPQAHLYLWSTAGHLPDAFDVLEAWGFTYKTYLVWTKPQMGMGNYFRISTELVLFGVKGGLRTNHRGLVNYFEAKRSRHSAKPEKFQDLVVQASPGPYLEMFARCYSGELLTGCRCSKCRLGWETWGNQS